MQNIFRYSQRILSSGKSLKEISEAAKQAAEQDQPVTSAHPSFSSLDPLTSSDEESDENEDNDDVVVK
jgi:hypothetical protein